MLIKEKLGNINNTPDHSRNINVLIIEWYEANKRILHKQTSSGENVTLKFLQENPHLKDGDILWQDNNTIIVIEIKPCVCIVFVPDTLLNASSFCYEVGNKHLPLFYEEDELLVPYEQPLYNLLQASGYQLKVEERKLNNALKTTVLPHSITGTGDSVVNKILQLTTAL